MNISKEFFIELKNLLERHDVSLTTGKHGCIYVNKNEPQADMVCIHADYAARSPLEALIEDLS